MPQTPEPAAIRAVLGSRMPALDGLRGLAILLVVWHNAGLLGGQADTVLTKLFISGANAGWVGVQLFLVLSGFLITGILLDTRGLPGAWRSFIVRRSLRIFPLYYAVLAFCFIVLPLVGLLPAWLEKDHQYQSWYWSYLVNWSAAFGKSGPGLGHFWSLAVEEQFYLLWPLAALLLPPRRVAWVAVLVIVMALVFRYQARAIMPTEFAATEAAYGFTIARADALAFGALVALALRDGRWAGAVLRHAGTIVLVSGIAIVAFAASQRGFGNMHWPVLIAGPTMTGVLFAGLVALVVVPVGRAVPVAAALSGSWLRTIGKYSYAIYVVHLPLAHVARGLLPAGWESWGGMTLLLTLTGVVVGVFLTSLLLAMVTWRLIESPALALRPPSPRGAAEGHAWA